MGPGPDNKGISAVSTQGLKPMSHEQSPLSVGEFKRWADRTDRTLAGIDVKVDRHAERITKVETIISERTTKAVKDARKTASGWSAAVAGFVLVLAELVRAYFK